jgi:hypothetical protein
VDSARAVQAEDRLRTLADARSGLAEPGRSRSLTAACLLGYWRVLQGRVQDAQILADRVRRDLARQTAPSPDGALCVRWLSASVAVERRQQDASRLVARLDSVLLHERRQSIPVLQAAAIVSARLHEKLGETWPAWAATRMRDFDGAQPFFLATQVFDAARFAQQIGSGDAATFAYTHFLALQPAPDNDAARKSATLAREGLERLRARYY